MTTLPALPNILKSLYCESNSITTLPTLPDSLILLNCSNNSLTVLPLLKNSLVNLYCSSNALTALPALPHLLKTLTCDHNQLTVIPVLPDSLQSLECENNFLTNLPILPNLLTQLICLNNSLTSLPALPNLLIDLFCDHNSLTNLPTLPNSLTTLYCQNNSLTTLPTLPDSLQLLWCDSNNITCFPHFPNSIINSNIYFSIDPNPYTCLPNYIFAMGSDTVIYPKCAAGNTHNCPVVDSCPPYMTFILTPSGTPHIWDAYPIYSSNVDSARWDWGDNTSMSGLYPSHTYSVDSMYSICVEVYSSCGYRVFCQNDSLYRVANSSTVITINVLHPSSSVIPITNSNQQIIIYPNPNNGNFIIETNATKKQTVQVFDLNGRLLLNQNINGLTNNIDATTLYEGIYTLAIKTTDRVINKKLVILR